MSLRVLLSLVVALALAALVVAVTAIASAFDDSDARARQRGEETAVAAVKGLVRAYRDLPAATTIQPRAPLAEALRTTAATALASVIETRGGYCWGDGTYVQVDSATMHGRPDGPFGPDDHGPPDEPPPGPAAPAPGPVRPIDSPGPPPHILAAIRAACASATADVALSAIEGPRDVIIIASQSVGPLAAFVTHIVPRSIGATGVLGSPLRVVVLALVTLALIGLALATIIWLGRGVGDVNRTLARLEQDLRADPAMPRTREFQAIAARLRTMARHLADARDRERVLERQIAHETRLASLGRTVAGVAHEIRNPLTGIKLLLDGMRRRGGDDRTRGEIAACLAEIARLDHVVSSFLGAARDSRAPVETIDLAALADERAALAARGAASTIATEGEAQLVAERDVVVRVLDNLIRNALEASPPGAPVTLRVSADAEMARCTVIDRGPGVPASLVGDLFEPFVTSKPDGTGLGLWLSHALVDARDGDLRYARVGDETHFTVSLPRVPHDLPADDPGGR